MPALRPIFHGRSPLFTGPVIDVHRSSCHLVGRPPSLHYRLLSTASSLRLVGVGRCSGSSSDPQFIVINVLRIVCGERGSLQKHKLSTRQNLAMLIFSLKDFS